MSPELVRDAVENQVAFVRFGGPLSRLIYFFVMIEAPVARRVQREKVQEVFQRLVDAPSWLVTVNNDPSDSIDATRIEKRSTDYSPDWSHNEAVPQWIAELPAKPRVDLETLRRRMKPLGALALISQTYRLVFDIHYMRLHAASKDDLDRFVGGTEGWFEEEEPRPSV
jgi:hypothetical protein